MTTKLSPRERTILVLVCDSLSDKEIAQRLLISPHTVGMHLRRVRDKTGMDDRVALALWAVRNGVIKI
jgi:DNA-binding CsgD family transcriptional regulator